MQHDVDVLIIGAGMSGLGLAVQLIRQYNTRNFEIIEKTTDISGTWWLNSYPGCGCDVPSHFYSYSFALNPNWSQKFALQPEIRSYFEDVASQYRIRPHVRFQSVVEAARWDEPSGMWYVTIRDLKTGKARHRTCKVLISAVGALSIPKKCDLPGASDFKGKIFHTAEWDHSFDWSNKQVVIVGNGCSATQIVPVISEGASAVRKVTQFSRQAHWLAERPNPSYSTLLKLSMRYVPLLLRLYRFSLYWEKEAGFDAFDLVNGADIRKKDSEIVSKYIRRNSPEKYRDFLVPKTEIGCKRRVNDTDYLKSLHRENVELVYDDPVSEIVENGVKTSSGRIVPADAIVLAHGFETQKFLAPMDIRGREGEGLNEHWQRVSEGVSSSYFGTCLSGFPNFFIMMGPNTLSGHLSVIYTTECQINFALRIIRPILSALSASRSSFPTILASPDVVDVKPAAEDRDVRVTQEKAKKLVWASGCTNWFVEEVTGRNSIMFPDWQYRFWWRSVFPQWKDFEYKASKEGKEVSRRNGPGSGTAVASLLASVAVGVGAWYLGRPGVLSFSK